MEEEKGKKQESNASATTGVYEIPGEPAIVINGVPEIVPSSSVVQSGNALDNVEKNGNLDLGEWFVGREIRKLFMGSYYSGKVTEYDKESGSFKILYEDGDSEDLDWEELKEVLSPLDVTISLKTLSQRVIRNRKSKKPIHKSGNDASSQNPITKTKRTKGKN